MSLFFSVLNDSPLILDCVTEVVAAATELYKRWVFEAESRPPAFGEDPELFVLVWQHCALVIRVFMLTLVCRKFSSTGLLFLFRVPIFQKVRRSIRLLIEN